MGHALPITSSTVSHPKFYISNQLVLVYPSLDCLINHVVFLAVFRDCLPLSGGIA